MLKNYFVTGIDTGIGKTVVTGLIAKYIHGRGKSVITHKPIQTGCVGMSEDIVAHRKIMGIDLLPEDKSGKTCPYTFEKPCSPHLAAQREGRSIHLTAITRSITELGRDFDYVIVEGAGGLYAPMTRETDSMGYVAQLGCSVILVSSSRLGSLHHTRSLLELLTIHEIPLAALIYNRFAEEDSEIGDDSLEFIKESMEKLGFSCPVIEIGELTGQNDYDFSCLL